MHRVATADAWQLRNAAPSPWRPTPGPKSGWSRAGASRGCLICRSSARETPVRRGW